MFDVSQENGRGEGQPKFWSQFDFFAYAGKIPRRSPARTRDKKRFRNMPVSRNLGADTPAERAGVSLCRQMFWYRTKAS